jgi:arylsulfatase A-like enzyme
MLNNNVVTQSCKIITCIFFLLLASQVNARQKKPNVVFFLVDDLGWTDVEPFGTTFYETPNIKKLSQESMIFKNAYAACPVCSPTRGSIMTGKYPVRTNTTDFFGGPQPQKLTAESPLVTERKLLGASYTPYMDLKEVTLAEAFQQGGYKTFIAGKWHLGKNPMYWPQHQGFEINKGGYNAGMTHSYFAPYKNPMLPDGPVGEDLTDRLAIETVNFIDQNRDQPFFAYFSFYSVHIPEQTTAQLQAKYEEKRKRLGLKDEFQMEGKSKVRTVQSDAIYAGMIEQMDAAIGKVINKLKEEGLYDNTIIVFFSDNGGLSTAEGTPTSNLPLRGGKGWLYEGGIREPMLVRWPGHTQGKITTTSVTSTDFYPSLLEMTGQKPRPAQHADGVSFVPLLLGKPFKRAPLYWHYPHYGNQGGSPGSAVLDGDWKLIRWYESEKEELFNLKDDIGEKKDLLKSNPKIAGDLRAKLDAWLSAQHALMPTKSPFYKPAK